MYQFYLTPSLLSQSFDRQYYTPFFSYPHHTLGLFLLTIILRLTFTSMCVQELDRPS